MQLYLQQKKMNRERHAAGKESCKEGFFILE